MDIAERLATVETKLDGVISGQNDMKKTMDTVATSVSLLAVLEEKHNTVSDSMKRAFNGIDKVNVKVESMTEKVHDMEVSLPYLKLASGWVFKAAIGLIGMLGAVAIGVIVAGLT